MVRGEKGDRGVLVRDAISRQLQFERRQLVRFQPVRPVVLSDDCAAILDVGEKRRHLRGKIVSYVEGANADDDGIESAQLFRGQVCVVQYRNGKPHLFQVFSHAVTRARQVTNRTSAGCEFKTNIFQSGQRLQQERRNMRVV